MLLNLCTIILPFLLSCNNRRCANLPRMPVRAYGSIKRKKERILSDSLLGNKLYRSLVFDTYPFAIQANVAVNMQL